MKNKRVEIQAVCNGCFFYYAKKTRNEGNL